MNDVDDLSLEQRKADNDVEQVKARRVRDHDRIDRGLVSSPKELEALQSEIVSLDNRIGDLEDTELEVMERLEEAQTTLSDLASELSAVDAEIADQEVARDKAAGELGEQRSSAASAREQTAATIPQPLLDLYERLRAQFNGVGAGELQGSRCGSCRLQVTPSEMAAFKASADDEVLRCEECQRILVRTTSAS